jgi:hypothetical protein
MKIAPVAELKAQFSAYLKSSAEGPVVVMSAATLFDQPLAELNGGRVQATEKRPRRAS